MDSKYITDRVKWIIASFVGVDAEDVDENMQLSEFNLGEMDVMFLLEKIEEEFECRFDTHKFSPDSLVLQIINDAN